MPHPLLRLLPLAFAALVFTGCGSHPPRSEPPLQAGTPRADAANAVLFRAIALVGTPYHFGGNTPQGGFDCSGLVGYVFSDAAGVTLPRSSRDMGDLKARKLDRDDLQAGDLVFFADGRHISHVGIYVGEGKFIHSPKPGAQVRVEDMSGSYWQRRFSGARRVATGPDEIKASGD